MSEFLNTGILIMFAAIPSALIFLIQILLCRYVKSPWVCAIPFWATMCMAVSIIISCVTGSIQSIIALYLVIYAFETISCMMLADIIAWFIGLFWRGVYVSKLKEQRENNTDTDDSNNEAENINTNGAIIVNLSKDNQEDKIGRTQVEAQVEGLIEHSTGIAIQ